MFATIIVSVLLSSLSWNLCIVYFCICIIFVHKTICITTAAAAAAAATTFVVGKRFDREQSD